MTAYGCEDRHLYQPPPCPHCGSEPHVEWTVARSFGSPDQWVPGLLDCLNSDCPGKPHADFFGA
jgi:hypothetical protein